MKEWAMAHPWMTFFLVFSLSHGVLLTIRRFGRWVTIILRGWPPPHLDADGDFRGGK